MIKKRELSKIDVIKEIERIYDDFLVKVKRIEAERDAKIQAILKRNENRNLKKLRQEINSIK